MIAEKHIIDSNLNDMKCINNSVNSSYKLLCWNVLCNVYCDEFSAPHLDPKFREWNYRKKLFSEIFKNNADIDLFCLQEVDEHKDFHELINNNWNKNNGSCIKDINDDFGSLHYYKKGKPLGISLFYRKNMFKVKFHFKYILKDDGKKLASNFVLVAFLEDNNNKSFCLLITHLKAFDEYEDIRLNQVESIFSMLESYDIFKENFLKFNCSSIILCGDFNASPHFPSIDKIKNFEFQIKNKNGKIISKSFLRSVFNYFDKTRDDYEDFTLCINKDTIIKKAIDYIFVTDNIEILDKQIFKGVYTDRGLPSEHFPSDHLFLTLQFRTKE